MASIASPTDLSSQSAIVIEKCLLTLVPPIHYAFAEWVFLLQRVGMVCAIGLVLELRLNRVSDTPFGFLEYAPDVLREISSSLFTYQSSLDTLPQNFYSLDRRPDTGGVTQTFVLSRSCRRMQPELARITFVFRIPSIADRFLEPIQVLTIWIWVNGPFGIEFEGWSSLHFLFSIQ